MTMKRSHGDFGWRRAGTESWVGVMIQRITLAIIRDLREEIDRAERKRETGTEEERETRWRIQAGIVTEYSILPKASNNDFVAGVKSLLGRRRRGTKRP